MYVLPTTRFSRFLLLLFLLLGASCDRAPAIPLPQAANDRSTLTPLPSPTAVPTATPVPGGAEGIGLAFYRAWEGKDYLGMYSVLSPQSQALVDSHAFVRLYEEVMGEATVQTLHARPLASRQDGDRAELNARVTWKTAVVGDVTRDYTMQLVYSQERWGVVWNESLILPELKGGQRLKLEYRIPSRANIYDVNGRALAYQGTAVTLGVVPGRITDEAGLLAALSPVLNKTPAEIKASYAAALPDWYWPIGDVASETIELHLDRLRPYFSAGLTTNERLTRIYPDGGVAPHIVGYSGVIPAERLDRYKAQGYRGDEQVGLAGVEAWGENYLSGIRGGVLTIVGAGGERVAIVQESAPRQARSIYTTLDREFQAAVEQALADAVASLPGSNAGSIVVMATDTGKIRAMASFPTSNPAVFDTVRTNAAADLNAVLNHPGRPLLNRATQGEYPPGSTFKIVTMAAGLASGLYTPESRYTSTGSWNRLGPNFIKYDWLLPGGHGTISLKQGLTVSCNSCFYDVGFNVNNLNIDLLPQVSRQFGLGAPAGIQGIAEAGGLIPDHQWKVATYGEGWAPGDAVNMAIGQGFVLVTPLQLTRVLAAVANGGTLFRPTLIDRIGSGGGAPEEQWPAEAVGELPLTFDHLEAIRDGLWRATNSPSGTATHQFQRLPVPIAGKTGTAETNGPPHAWFAGYAPAAPYTRSDGAVIEQPEIAIVVMMENAGQGSDIAAPIFRRIVELYYNVTPLTPYPWQR
jgi:penicillin-binding protein 2